MTIKKPKIGVFALALLIPFVLIACQNGSTEVSVSLVEWGIELQPETVKSGEITFLVKNAGFIEHNFIIEGTDSSIPSILAQGEDSITTILEPGTYSIVCSLPGHQEAGMETQFTVLP